MIGLRNTLDKVQIQIRFFIPTFNIIESLKPFGVRIVQNVSTIGWENLQDKAE